MGPRVLEKPGSRWQLKYFWNFHPKSWGFMIPIWRSYFCRWGWFNHQHLAFCPGPERPHQRPEFSFLVAGNKNEGDWGRNSGNSKTTLQGTKSPKNGILKMIFLFPRWDMLVPWRVCCMWNAWNLHIDLYVHSSVNIGFEVEDCWNNDLQQIWIHCSEAQQLARDLPLFERWSWWLASILSMERNSCHLPEIYKTLEIVG